MSDRELTDAEIDSVIDDLHELRANRLPTAESRSHAPVSTAALDRLQYAEMYQMAGDQGAAMRQVIAELRARGNAVDQANPRLPQVDANTIIFRGISYPVEPHLSRWVKELLHAFENNEKVSDERFLELAPGKNVWREFKKLAKLIPGWSEIIASKSVRAGGRYFDP